VAPPSTPYGAPIPLEAAKKAMAAPEADATKNNWGVAIAIAGLTRVPVVVMAMLACAGGADMISGVYRSTITAAVTPDEMRGRVSGVEIAVYAGGPVLGDVEAGVVGGLLGVPFAIVSGGVACVLSAAVFATRVRSFAAYRRR